MDTNRLPNKHYYINQKRLQPYKGWTKTDKPLKINNINKIGKIIYRGWTNTDNQTSTKVKPKLATKCTAVGHMKNNKTSCTIQKSG